MKKMLFVKLIKRLLLLSIVLVLLFPGFNKADPVSDWNEIASNVIFKELRPNAVSIIDITYVHIAIYDAVNSIDKRFSVFAVEPNYSVPWASKEAAAISAAYRVLITFFPDQKAFLDSVYDAKLNEISNDGTKMIGISIGDEVATKFLKMREDDGRNADVPYTFGSGIGVYQITPGAPPPPATPATPWLARMMPFAMDSSSQFRAPAPNPVNSSVYNRDLVESKQYGSLNNSLRTDQMTKTGMFYTENSGLQFSRNLRLLSSAHNFSIADNARFFAQLYITMSDAIIATWESKFYYNRWRPVTAIRAAGLDTAWLPLAVTPNHPEYPAAHGAGTGGLAYALERFFSTSKIDITLTSTSVPGVPMMNKEYHDINDIIPDVINGRIYGGMHFRSSVEAGAAIAFNVANWVADHKFKPIQISSLIPTAGLQFWVRADSGLVLSGNTVSRWSDQSGNGNDAIQSDTSRQPILVSDELNHNPVLRFDGVNDKLGLTGTKPMGQISLFIVEKPMQGATGGVPYYPIVLGDGIHGYGLSMQNQFSDPVNSPDEIDPFASDSSWVRAKATSISTFGQWKVISVTADKNVYNTTLRANGVDASIIPQGTVNTALSVTLGNSTGTAIGGIGCTDGAPLGRLIFKGDIAEVIVYDTVLSSSDRLAVEKYLNDKYHIFNFQIPTAGLQLWVRADSGVVMNGSTVSRWTDLSGNGNDAIQTDTTRQPLLINNGLNQKPVLRFDGVNDRLGLTGTKLISQISLFIVEKADAGATGPNPYYPIEFGDPSGGKRYGLNMQNHFSNYSPDEIDPFIDTYSWVKATAPGIAEFGKWKSISVTTDKNMWNTTLRVNGVDAVITREAADSTIGFPLGNATGTDIGGIGGIDGEAEGHLIFKGDIAEVIVYDTVLSSSDRLAVEKYLNDKYQVNIAQSVKGNNLVPEKYSLEQNYPNPFNPSTTIKYSIAKQGLVKIAVYNALGQKVKELVNEVKDAGSYNISFNASSISSGIYFYKIETPQFSEVKKMILLK